MKKFIQIYEQYLRKTTQLVRIRLKVDPRIKEKSDFSLYDGYEGYILEEGDKKGHVKIIIADFGITEVPLDMVSFAPNLSTREVKQLISFTIPYCCKHHKITPGVCKQLQQCNTFDEFEKILITNASLTNEDLKKLYRKYILSNGISKER